MASKQTVQTYYLVCSCGAAKCDHKPSARIGSQGNRAVQVKPTREPVRTENVGKPGKPSMVATYEDEPGLLAVGAYARLSAEKTTEDLQSLALDRQDVSGAVKPHGAYVAREYVDPDHSGYKRNVVRPAYDLMIDDLLAGVIKGIAVYDVDRLTRRHGTLEKLIDIYADRDRKEGDDRPHPFFWFCLDDKVDLRTEDGRNEARRRVTAANAEAEAAQRRQKRRHEQAKRMGTKVGVVGMGHNRDGTIHPEEAKVLRDLADLVEKGLDIGPKLEELKAAGVVTAAGRPLSRESVRRILMTARLAGLRVDGKAKDGIARDEKGQPIQGTQEAILKLDQWQKIVRIYEKRSGRRDLVGARRYLGTGLLRCGRCGYAMGGGWQKQRNTYRYLCPYGGQRCGRNPLHGEWTDEFIKATVEKELARHAPVVVEHEPWPQQALMDATKARKAKDEQDYQDGVTDAETWLELDRATVLVLADLRKDERAWLADHAVPAVPAKETLMDKWSSGDDSKMREVALVLFEAFVVSPGGRWSADRFTLVPRRH